MLIPKNVFPIVNCASSDEMRYNLNGVYLERVAGKAYATTTNGHALVRVQWNEFPEADSPLKDGKPIATTLDGFKAIIPSDQWKLAAKLVKKSHVPILNTLAIDEVNANGKVQVSTLDSSMTITPINGEFPDIKSVYPKGKATFVIGFNPELLADVLSTLAKILGDNKPCVKLEFTDKGAPVKITGHNSNGDEIEALVMPMRIE